MPSPLPASVFGGVRGSKKEATVPGSVENPEQERAEREGKGRKGKDGSEP